MTPLTHRSNFYKNPTHMQGARKVIAYFEAEVLTQTDYYTFGAVMPDRQWSVGAAGYRYGFGGQEGDSEISGTGNSYSAEYWQYDVSIRPSTSCVEDDIILNLRAWNQES